VAEADAAGRPVLVLGGGSNLVVGEELGQLVVVRDRRAGARAAVGRKAVRVSVHGGAAWDALVAWTVERGWPALAPLSGVPGSVGALPVQNVGAYGASAGDLIELVRAYDRESGRVVEAPADQLQFGYRDSALKRSAAAYGGITPRWVVLEVTFALPQAGAGRPGAPGADAPAGVEVRYRQLADALGVPVAERAPGPAVRQAVLAIRRSKGMVLDPEDHDTWSAGSYFTNPVVPPAVAAGLPPEAPQFAAEAPLAPGTASDRATGASAGWVKTSAAWLMTQAGVERGRGLSPAAKATTSSKHVLALTNRGGATAADVLALEAWIVERVRGRFGVSLTREPVLVN
jgi:UDP-N-acetylmuramate dehydrogenase